MPKNIFKVKINQNSDGVMISLPPQVSSLLKVGANNEVFATYADGILQISGERPNVTIPALPLETGKFLRQIID